MHASSRLTAGLTLLAAALALGLTGCGNKETTAREAAIR